eukprot:gene29014-38059_t
MDVGDCGFGSNNSRWWSSNDLIGLIAGAAGVIALPMAKLVESHGTQYMAAAVILSGLMESMFGYLRLAPSGAWLSSALLAPTIAVTALCITIIRLLPIKFKKSKIPPSLAGIVGATVASIALKLPVKSLSDSVGKSIFVGGVAALPVFQGVLETILAERIACDSYRCRMSVFEMDDPDRTSIGLGLGNIVSSLFGGFGGCGLAVLVFSPLIGAIPMAALAG